MTALPTTANFFEYERVYLPRNELIREESMATIDYIRLFFPFRMPDYAEDEMAPSGRSMTGQCRLWC